MQHNLLNMYEHPHLGYGYIGGKFTKGHIMSEESKAKAKITRAKNRAKKLAEYNINRQLYAQEHNLKEPKIVKHLPRGKEKHPNLTQIANATTRIKDLDILKNEYFKYYGLFPPRGMKKTLISQLVNSAKDNNITYRAYNNELSMVTPAIAIKTFETKKPGKRIPRYYTHKGMLNDKGKPNLKYTPKMIYARANGFGHMADKNMEKERMAYVRSFKHM